MIQLSSIQWDIDKRDRKALRELFKASLDAGIEGCDKTRKATLRLSMIEAALFGTPDFFENLAACLDAIRRGYHPREDVQARAVLETNAAIAGAQLESRFG